MAINNANQKKVVKKVAEIPDNANIINQYSSINEVRESVRHSTHEDLQGLVISMLEHIQNQDAEHRKLKDALVYLALKLKKYENGD